MPGLLPIKSGLPIVINDEIVSAIGSSGVKSDQDGQIARTALDALI